MLTTSVYLYLSPELPSSDTLRTVKLQIPLRVYTADHRLMAEFGEMRRRPLAFEQIPGDFINAILAAEDDRFYEHAGVDLSGLIRASRELILTGSIQSGGSTITMQVARNFFLTREQSFIRKFNEILLALRIDKKLSKEEILTLYANKIYLGNRAYGVEAAAQVYYGVSVDQLSLDQIAMIAGLPKAPSRYNPLSDPERSTERRNWILDRMLKLGYIDPEQHKAAINTVDNASYHSPDSEVEAPYAAEMARREAVERWGLEAYTDGYVVTTTLDTRLQAEANKAVREGLHQYDWRHGYRGPELHIDDTESRAESLKQIQPVNGLLPALVTDVTSDTARLLFRDGETRELALANNSFRLYINENARSATVEDLTEVFEPGDVIRVRQDDDGNWKLTQIPKVQGALVALDPENGAIRAIVGGYSFATSNFNRATQATRQPGSNFKPFIYTRALEKGMSPATLINDAPIVFHDPHQEKVWRPENASGKFFGPTPLRTALYHSRNLVSVRILRQIGIDYAIDGMSRFGFDESSLPRNLSLALGTLGTTPLEIAQGYTIFANGGYKVDAHLVDRVAHLEGDILYQARPATVCVTCEQQDPNGGERLEEASSLQELFAETETTEDTPVNPARQVVDPRIAYLMDSMLKDVVRRGTGRKASALEREDIGGKTGTTNGPRDAWFSGYSPHLVTTVWVGFDENSLLGRNEYGGSAALPIWIDFMEDALEGRPEVFPPQPPGLVTVRINPATGKRSPPGDPTGEFEFFLRENLPEQAAERRSSTTGSNEESVPEQLFW